MVFACVLAKRFLVSVNLLVISVCIYHLGNVVESEMLLLLIQKLIDME